MTIKDLYEEAVRSGREDYDIRVSDPNGYFRYIYASEVDWDDKMQNVTID